MTLTTDQTFVPSIDKRRPMARCFEAASEVRGDALS
jgi:hypothetical protein